MGNYTIFLFRCKYVEFKQFTTYTNKCQIKILNKLFGTCYFSTPCPFNREISSACVPLPFVELHAAQSNCRFSIRSVPPLLCGVIINQVNCPGIHTPHNIKVVSDKKRSVLKIHRVLRLSCFGVSSHQSVLSTCYSRRSADFVVIAGLCAFHGGNSRYFPVVSQLGSTASEY